MDLYCWGHDSSDHLGMNGDGMTDAPRQIPWRPDEPVRQIAFGEQHTLFLTADGKVYECGNNDHSHTYNTRKRLRMSPFGLLPNLREYVVGIACGSRHSMVLTHQGKVLSWGENDCGQLGHSMDKQFIHTPKILRTLEREIVVQIACGNQHSLALTRCGKLYSWGSNCYGQLGVSEPDELTHCTYPTLLTSILGIPISAIACGGNHSFLISKSSAVFGWGRNNCGQLGLADESNRAYPTQLEILRAHGVRFVACGDEFSVFLTNEGGVFTCGSAANGQLGHNSRSNELVPRKVMELVNSTVTQVACGKHQTLAYVASSGLVYSFGHSDSGGTLAQVIIGPWLPEMAPDSDGVVIHQLFAGALLSIVSTTLFADNVPSVDLRNHITPETQILTLTAEISSRFFEDLLDVLESQCCLSGSFLLTQHFNCSIENNGLNIKEAQVAFGNLQDLDSDEHKRTLIWQCLTKELIPSLVKTPPDVESMRVYLILPLYHEFVDFARYKTLHVPFAKAIIELSEYPSKVLKKWWSQMPKDYYENLVTNFLHVVMHIVGEKMGINFLRSQMLLPYNYELKVVLKLLEYLFIINAERMVRLDNEVFYWNGLTDYVDIKLEYFECCTMLDENLFNICNFPFLMDTSAKSKMLEADQSWQLQCAINSASLNFTTFASFEYELSLHVRRENLVQDSLKELRKKCKIRANDLKKPLSIGFRGEEADDGGGVRREFFMLLLKEIFHPKFGMFKLLEESRLLWFADLTFENENEFYLLGVIYGLAVYNSTIINLAFPLAMYKKLLGRNVDLSDLRELLPTEGNSMQALLDYNGDGFEDTFGLTFEKSKNVFGQLETINLLPNGNQISVTLENRDEFVDLYVDFVFNKSVKRQYEAFHEGFMKVCSGRAIQSFQPEELKAVVVGTDDYDWQEFQNNCKYAGDYSPADKTIKWFWSVFHELSEEEKRNFLIFLTSSDRIPIEGMRAIKIRIQPTYDDQFLPVAHTCFHLLDLPRYKTKAILKHKLQQAIQHTQGFGLI